MVKLTRYLRLSVPIQENPNYYRRKGGWVHRHYRNTSFGMYLIDPYYRNGTFVRKRNRKISLEVKSKQTHPLSLDDFFRSRGILLIKRTQPEKLEDYLKARPYPPK